MYQAKSGVKKFSLYWRGGGSFNKKFFFWSEPVSSQIWCQKFFPLLGIGGSLDKIFFPSLNMYQAKSGVKKFSLYWGGGEVPQQKNFFPVWTCSKPNLVSKIFPFPGRGGVPWQKFFFPVWTCIKPNLVSKKFPFTWGGVPHQKNFSPVWTCIKPNLVSNNFPFTGGGPSTKIFFPVWTCIKPNLVSKIFPFTGGGGPLTKKIFPGLNMYQAKSGVKNFSLYWDQVPPSRPETGYPPPRPGPGTPPPPPLGPGPGTPLPPDLDLGPPPDLRLGTPPTSTWNWDPPDVELGPPPTWTWTWDPPLGVDWQTENSTFPHPSDAGGNNQHWDGCNLMDFKLEMVLTRTIWKPPA